MSGERMTAEEEALARRSLMAVSRLRGGPCDLWVDIADSLLRELDAVRAERDEASEIIRFAFGNAAAKWTQTASIKDLAAALVRSRNLWRDSVNNLTRERDEARKQLESSREREAW